MDSNLDNVGTIQSKTPFYKQPWFYIIISALVIIIAGVLFYLDASGVNSKSLFAATEEKSTEPEAVSAVDATPAPESSEIIEKWLFDITFDEWLANLNQYRTDQNGSTIDLEDIEYEDTNYSFSLNDYAECICMCPEGPEDDRIYVTLMALYSDGTEEGMLSVLSAMGDFITAFHPEYTTDEKAVIIDDLLVLDDAGESFVPTYLTVDETYYYLEVDNDVIYLAASALLIKH